MAAFFPPAAASGAKNVREAQSDLKHNPGRRGWRITTFCGARALKKGTAMRHSFISSSMLVGVAAAAIMLAPMEPAQAKGLEVIHAFQGGADGSHPSADLIADAAGNLYGTTAWAGNCEFCGTVFRIAPDGTETDLHVFGAFDGDGELPEDAVTIDAVGNLYGTTVDGGASGLGTVFEIAPDGAETLLHSFSGMVANPYGGLLLDKKGNLVGTTNLYAGTVFKLTAGGKFKVIYTFDGYPDGSNPLDTLISDRSGNLYGTLELGGPYDGYNGTIFELSSQHVATTLYAFSGTSDGCNPGSRLLRDKSGNLYGTASGSADETSCGLGTVFKLAPGGTLTVLHSFSGSDGEYPFADVISDKKGNLYGTTFGGGSEGCGVVFAIAPDGSYRVLHDFQGASDGCGPIGGLLLLNGALYGTAAFDGQYGYGIVFRIRK
jgi:uncharacterized repeat protein (TIGR03803 family)